ncbi:MAG: NADH-quinone oxidoreductase subunit C [Cephaloticoccus sp.]|nr:NADH-quinone oxidoreductase subunit C [Cephaloticoccus sp.]MCF7759544.1 NADH-quinone oxidoreductase subunit C [Cephaloticoccus sp.]
MPTTTADVTSAILEKFPQAAVRASLDHAAIDVPATELLAVMQTLRDAHGFDMLMDLTAIDWAEGAAPRFVAVYHLYSSTNHEYFRVATACTGDDEAPVVPSVTSLWPGANWHERETYDMFGIKFEGHPDLRRILMWEGYPHYPLRKEFPLAGIETELPDPEVAAETGTKVKPAPMAGGPFVASSGEMNLTEAEPRAKDESWNESSEKPEA